MFFPQKAIGEQHYAYFYASLCFSLRHKKVPGRGNKKISFKELLICKCKSQFELYKEEEINSAKKFTELNTFKDPVMFNIY